VYYTVRKVLLGENFKSDADNNEFVYCADVAKLINALDHKHNVDE